MRLKIERAFPPVTFTDVVKNTGAVDLTDVVVVDNNGTLGYTADDWTFTWNAVNPSLLSPGRDEPIDEPER